MQRVVLLASSHEQRIQEWQALVRRAGYLPLVASTADRTLFFLGKIRPAVLLLDAELGDGAATVAAIVRELRAMPPCERLPVVVMGSPALEVQDTVARDPCLWLRRSDDDVSLADLLAEVLG